MNEFNRILPFFTKMTQTRRWASNIKFPKLLILFSMKFIFPTLHIFPTRLWILLYWNLLMTTVSNNRKETQITQFKYLFFHLTSTKNGCHACVQFMSLLPTCHSVSWCDESTHRRHLTIDTCSITRSLRYLSTDCKILNIQNKQAAHELWLSAGRTAI